VRAVTWIFFPAACPAPSGLTPLFPAARSEPAVSGVLADNCIRAGHAACRYSWRMPVVVEYPAAGLTWDYGTDMIGAHVCLPGLPAAGDRAVLARTACPVLIVQGRGDTRAAARGGRAEPPRIVTDQAVESVSGTPGPLVARGGACGRPAAGPVAMLGALLRVVATTAVRMDDRRSERSCSGLRSQSTSVSSVTTVCTRTDPAAHFCGSQSPSLPPPASGGDEPCTRTTPPDRPPRRAAVPATASR
jgi:hypothetical protein